MYESLQNYNHRTSSQDVQFEICSQFIKLTSERLLTQELELIRTSENFINTLNEQLILKDISITQDTLTYEPSND